MKKWKNRGKRFLERKGVTKSGKKRRIFRFGAKIIKNMQYYLLILAANAVAFTFLQKPKIKTKKEGLEVLKIFKSKFSVQEICALVLF